MVASIFNPDEDHSDQQQRGFPCMHHVTFEQHGETGLGITGIYATQYYFGKAYGNLLGLSRLGHFMARALGKQLNQVTCIASVAQLDESFTKEKAKSLNSCLYPAVCAARNRMGGLFGQ